MSHPTLAAIVSAIALAASPALADDGNGNGNAYLKHTPVEIGGTLHIQWGSPTAPFGPTLLVISDGIGPSPWPGLGSVCLDLFSPGTEIVVDQTLDAMGNASISVDIPDLPGLATLAPIFACALVIDTSLANPFSITKTVGLYLENPDSCSSTSGNLGVPRAYHTATALAVDAFDDETEVLVAGGGGAQGAFYAPSADATTELFSPMTRTFRPGPMMSEARVMHGAVRLASGLVLIGGVNGTTTLDSGFVYLEG
ncbi:MAG: hypothetical protein R3F20_00880 [Planctomycetota bacterium]